MEQRRSFASGTIEQASGRRDRILSSTHRPPGGTNNGNGSGCGGGGARESERGIIFTVAGVTGGRKGRMVGAGLPPAGWVSRAAG